MRKPVTRRTCILLVCVAVPWVPVACSSSSPVQGFTLPPDAGEDEDVVEAAAHDVRDAASDAAVPPLPGDLLVSEIMFDPSGPEPDSEWFEVYNAASGPRILEGVVVGDKSGRDTKITSTPPLVIAAHAYQLFVHTRSAAIVASVPHAADAYEYGDNDAGPMLTNGVTGAVQLSLTGVTIAEVDYGGWFTEPAPGGASIELKTLTPAGEKDKAAWCLAPNAWPGGNDEGTPGSKNDCP